MSDGIINLIIFLIPMVQESLTIKLMIIEEGRERLLKYLLGGNASLAFMAFLYNKCTNDEVGMWVAIELTFMTIMYLLYNFIFKEKINKIIDAKTIEDKDENREEEFIEELSYKFKRRSIAYKVSLFIFIPASFMIKYYAPDINIIHLLFLELLLGIGYIGCKSLQKANDNKMAVLKEI